MLECDYIELTYRFMYALLTDTHTQSHILTLSYTCSSFYTEKANLISEGLSTQGVLHLENIALNFEMLQDASHYKRSFPACFLFYI